MKKIAIITNIPAPYRVDLFNYLQDNYLDYEFNIIYTSLNEDNRKWNVDVNKLKNSYVLNSKIIKKKQELDYKYIHIPVGLKKNIKKIKPDVIIGFEYNISALNALFLSKLYRIKYIHLTDGTLFSERNIGKLQKIFRKIIIKNADACIASSTKSKEKLIYWGANEEKIFTSYLTVNIENFINKKTIKDNSNLLYVGSFIKRKGLDLLLDALSLIKNNFKLKIIGNGTEEEIKEINNLIEKYNLQDKIIIEGFKTGQELIEEYKNASAFILPSREDCFGLVLVEALCSYTPIISSKYADGSYDTIIDGENGYIIDPYDKEQFASAIEKVLNGNINLDKVKDYDKNIDKFRFKNVTKAYIDALEYVLKK